MGEIKSVKVDNWGVFFLQKLQNFFNKTDYCDLTLQFRDNSQLKVHRLVLSACTDYFNVLEQTCEVVDDAIIMPNGLQADVVVPIVNFMYTGTLEFELKMYNRLLRTAKDMNMTVLLKLLEAHRRTMEMHPQKTAAPASPKPRRKTAAQAAAGNVPSNAAGRSLIQTNQGKRLVVGSNVNAPQQRNVSTGNTLTRLPAAGQLPLRQIGSTTFTRIKVENEQHESNTPTAGGGYTLLKQSPQQPQQPTSPFEQLRKGYNNNKRPAVSTFVSPPAKKPNLEDVKEFAEQQRMRKQIAAEYGDDDYDASNIMDDDTIHNDDDDDEMTSAAQTPQTSATSASAGVQTVASQNQQQQQSEDPPGTTTIIVKHEGPDKPPTIVVKDNSNSKMNHAKIISEVLRQYPHLVKSNKNIKLKIMPNAGGQAQKIIVKKEPMEPEKPMQPPPTKLTTGPKLSDSQPQQSSKSLAASIVANRPKILQQQQAEITSSGKTSQPGVNKTAAGASTATAAGQPQKRRIDSKTMHALIALGAENTTGPWLCLRCGRNGHPISIPSYRGFRRHLINTHKETIDPALCEHCGWRSASKRELHFHMQLEHNVKTNLYIFPECQLCQQMCIDSDGLNQHLIDSHPDENKQQCIYCNKIFPEEIQLYTHMKTFHKKQALEDGIIDYSDDENQGQATLTLPSAEYEQKMELEHKQQQQQQQQEKKINILSDISLPIASSIIKTDSFVQQHESTTSAASEEYLQDQEHEQEHTETKFVAADGSEVILTAEQRKEILSQLNQEHEGSGVVMVVNENPQQAQYGVSGETQSDQGAISHDETSQATTATNEERHEEEEEEEEEDEQVAEEEDDQHDDNQIYNEMKAMHSNLEEDSTSQTDAAAEAEEASMQEEEPEPEPEPEHEPELEPEEEENEAEAEHEHRAEHLDESKESIDNLEWAENLLSEHDLADEVSSSQSTNKNTQSNKPEEKEEEIKDEDNKSQDEISKKLKELTGDWSEDDDEDMPEEEPLPELSTTKEITKEKPDLTAAADVEMAEAEVKEAEIGTLAKEHEDNVEFEDHAELLASLQSTEKDDVDEHKEIASATPQVAVDDSENIDEDDIDMALKSLHKEDVEEEDIKTAEPVEETPANDENDKKESEKTSEPAEEVAEKLDHDVTEELAKKDEAKEEKQQEEAVKQEDIKETKATEEDKEDKPEEKLVKELETLEEPEATSSSAMVVDEETKKDLIDSLLSEQAETMEDTAAETPTTTATVKQDEVNKVEGGEADATATETTTEVENIKSALVENTPSLQDEFLDIATDKTTAEETSIDDNVDTTTAATSSTTTTTTTITSATEAAATTAEVAEASSTSGKEETTITSEERVKSLISEWGDDDEDEDDNDTYLTANL